MMTNPTMTDSKVNFVMLEDDGNDFELFNRDSIFHDRASWSKMIAAKRLEYRMRFDRYQRLVTIVGIVLVVVSLLFIGIGWWKGRGRYYEDEAHFQHEVDQWLEESIHLSELEAGVCREVAVYARVDCNPDPPISRDVCWARGCCWSAGNESLVISEKNLPPIGVPYCYFGSNYTGYKIIDHHDYGHRHVIELRRVRPSGFRSDVELLTVTFEETGNSKVGHLKIEDKTRTRYEVPIPKLNLPPIGDAGSNEKKKNPKFAVELNRTTTRLMIRHAGTKHVLWSSLLAQLIYSDQFLQFTIGYPASSIYGLGEHMGSFQKHATWQRYTQWARDQYPKEGEALYGAHNFFMWNMADIGLSGGHFMFNSNAMDIITQPGSLITYRTIGGVIDFYSFYSVRTPDEVVKDYVSLIGRPQMPPYWALGFHLSRFGYQTLENMTRVSNRTQEANIPYDVQWTDIDMFEANNDFTYDTKRFAGLPEFIDKLHADGRRFVPMFDCGISSGEKSAYSPFDEGRVMNVFVRNASGKTLTGKVWNTKSTVWPDFFHPNATIWWTRQFARYHKEISFDGAWIDMNEPSNFFDGSDIGCPVGDSLEEPQYTPGMDDESKRLKRHTLCMTARQAAGRHYDLHNLYGFSEAIATNKALQTILPNQRPFIISRSTAPGHGAFASHWTGDVVSDWGSMRASIASLLNFNLFGIPMVGADICGFNGNTTEELCARWHQLGAFYTFVRNHNTDNGIEQDPVALGPRVILAARTALEVRYRHLAYLYGLFWRAATEGATVVRPIFFEFPYDRIAASLETQFLWGGGLMIAPALKPGASSIQVYFPEATWYRVRDLQLINGTCNFVSEEAHFDHPNVYYRAGVIFPVQKPEVTTNKTRAGPFELVVALDPVTGNASGELYWDKGDGLDTEMLGVYNLYKFELADDALSIKSDHLGFQTPQAFEKIVVIGLPKMPNDVLVDGVPARFQYSITKQTLSLDVRLALYPNDERSIVQHLINWRSK